MHLLYAVATWIALLLGAPILLTHKKLRHGIRQRLGLYPPGFGDAPRGGERPGSPRIWLHGASAGDLLSLQPMMKELKARRPGCFIIVSCITNSGHEIALKKLAEADLVVYAPYDTPGATRRAMRALRPDLLVLEYTEIWPGLIRAAARAGARIALTNGRFNPAKLGRYRLLFRIVGNPLRAITCFLMRSDEEAERVLQLGASPDRVWVTGNTKFDALVLDPGAERAEALRREMGLDPARPVLMAGSTHEGEEPLLLQVFASLAERHPGLQLVIAPRYVNRAGRIMALAAEAGLGVRLRSGGPGAGSAAVTVLDTIGELAAGYSLATLVFVGGSFVTRGGQNVLEPAAQGKPVLFGPHMENFKDSVQVLQGRGGIQVGSPEQLLKVADELLSAPDQIAELGALARRAVSGIRGASARNVEHMLAVLPREGAPVSDLGEAPRILVVRYSALGDVVLATSVLAPLRRRFPSARIEWVTSAAAAPLLEGLPELEAVHRLGKAGDDTPAALQARLGGRFDLAIDLQEKVKSLRLVRAAAPRRLHFHRRTLGQALLSLVGRDRPLVRAHATRLYAEVLAPLGGDLEPGPLRIAPSPQARAAALAALAGARRPLVAIAPGATWATKRWAPERFAAVADALHADGYGLVLCAGPTDAEAVAAFRAALRAPLAADLTPLKVDAMAAALGEVRLLVSNDSGPVHLASALGVPALVLFGPTSTVRWAPPPPGRALSLALSCQPCSNHGGERCPLGHHRCLADLPVAQALAAARGLLA